MIIRDFHNTIPNDVRREVDSIIGNIRAKRSRENVKFITGRGYHKRMVMEILDEYGLKGEYQWGNEGVINVTVE